MTPEWIVATCAVVALLGTGVAQWAGVKSEVKALKVTVTSLDLEMAKMVTRQIRQENLMAAILGDAHPMVRKMREES